MRLEEEINEGQLVDRHPVLDADRHGVDRLGQVHLGHNLCPQNPPGLTGIDNL
ncbi:hypothetical protein D3C79_1116570 [compost metagenome]